jgi:HTH-type transcriptional regulator/antitoxin HigA
LPISAAKTSFIVIARLLVQASTSRAGRIVTRNLDVNRTTNAWASLVGTVFVPHNEMEYRKLVALLDGLTDEVGEEESHSLASLMEIVGVLVEAYESEHVPELITE